MEEENPLAREKALTRAEQIEREAQWGYETARSLGIREPAVPQENYRQAAALYTSRAFMGVAAAMAGVHPHALDYLKQCELLPLAICKGQKSRSAKNYHFVLVQWKTIVSNGIPLKQMLRMLQIPKQYRAISGRAIYGEAWWPLVALAYKADPSTLAQIMPKQKQAQWLRCLAAYVERAVRAGRTTKYNNVPGIVWLAREAAKFGAYEYSPEDCGDMADFVLAMGEQFNPQWDWAGAHERRQQWHADLNAKKAAKTDVIDPYPFPAEYKMAGGFEFVALRSGAELVEEGRAMHHCVAGYDGLLYSRASQIISVRYKGERRDVCPNICRWRRN